MDFYIMNILIVGGAGYIGSHMVKRLSQDNYQTITLDNLSSGYRAIGMPLSTENLLRAI